MSHKTSSHELRHATSLAFCATPLHLPKSRFGLSRVPPRLPTSRAVKDCQASCARTPESPA
ncbi:BQ5605_C007g04794 [Microbotryum silenes-dioicae]|uniref:BQ5605_C007g04794 protein n=1 Tax=Microbotryum silenes-dioicae TaxID=796604 RepID=A0A2X0MC39_9BASI|nr:BQ5605_C007g04794 [Microbotryum silenes-dioicae]